MGKLPLFSFFFDHFHRMRLYARITIIRKVSPCYLQNKCSVFDNGQISWVYETDAYSAGIRKRWASHESYPSHWKCKIRFCVYIVSMLNLAWSFMVSISLAWTFIRRKTSYWVTNTFFISEGSQKKLSVRHYEHQTEHRRIYRAHISSGEHQKLSAVCIHLLTRRPLS